MAEPRVSVHRASLILGLPWRETQKILRRMEMIYPSDAYGRHDARVLDLIRALRGQPHRELKAVENDWLSAYLKEK